MLTGHRVTAVSPASDGVVVRFEADGSERAIHARAAVVATPAPTARRIIGDLPAGVARALEGISYGPYVVGAFLTGEMSAMPYDGVYAAATPGLSFNMLFNTANVVRRGGARQPGGTLMVYSAAQPGSRALPGSTTRTSSGATWRISTACSRPCADVSVRSSIRRWERGLPHPRPGRHLLQPALERPLGAIHLAGDYLGTTYIETAIETGAAAARRIRGTLAP